MAMFLGDGVDVAFVKRFKRLAEQYKSERRRTGVDDENGHGVDFCF